MAEASKANQTKRAGAEQGIDLKQRLVGAVVLISLGIILIPMLLNGGSNDLGIDESNIPPLPDTLKAQQSIPAPVSPPEPVAVSARPIEVPEDIPAVETPKPSPVTETTTTEQVEAVNAADSPAQVEMRAPQEPTELVQKQAAPVEQAGPSTKLEQGYVVQVASFSQQEKAFTLRDRLRGEQLHSYIEQVKTANGIRYRVRVGPYVSHADTRQKQQQIEQLTELETVITDYRP